LAHDRILDRSIAIKYNEKINAEGIVYTQITLRISFEIQLPYFIIMKKFREKLVLQITRIIFLNLKKMLLHSQLSKGGNSGHIKQ
jgi:hypothetical protein